MKSKMHSVEARRYFRRAREERENNIKLIVISVVGFYAFLLWLGVAGIALVEWWAR